MNFTYMNIRSGTTSNKSLRFTFGNVHEMPGWSTWLSEYIFFFLLVYSLKLDGVMCIVFSVSDTKSLGSS